jgi:hypothetical protein
LSSAAEAIHRFEAPWIEVGRVYRRICFLRAEGSVAEAQFIEQNDFSRLVESARESCKSPAEADLIMENLLRSEQARVADAIAYAEVLAPMLAKQLSHLVPGARAAAASAPVQRPRQAGRDDNRGIADFIDDMLAQERTGTG